MQDLEVVLDCPPDLDIHTDNGLMRQIIENLLINAREAEGSGPTMRIRVKVDSKFGLYIQDSGSGTKDDLLPHALFVLFKTTKPIGNGIDLWQV